MCARNRRITNERWATARAAARWVVAKVRTGIIALGLRGALLVVLAVGSLSGISLAHRYVGRMRRFRVYTQCLKPEAPPWCVDDLGKVQLPRESYSIFDPRLTRAAARAYAASAWVEAVRRVEKRLPNDLVVELELRRPVALVRQRSGDRAIDRGAIVLPLREPLWDGERLPYIFGVDTKAAKPGERWADARVAAALAVLEALRTAPDILARIHGIDVQNHGGAVDPSSSEIVLYADGRVQIAWGRAPRPDDTTEIPVAEKLVALRRRVARPVPPCTTIDLRFRSRADMARR